MAQASGMRVLADEDITHNTMPTYRAMRRLYAGADLPDGVKATDLLAEMAQRGWLQYRILSFEMV
jgi:hypothetical protein